MKSKYLAFLLLRLFSIIYFTIYSIPAIISSISIISSFGQMRFGFETTSLFLFLFISILIPIIIWFGTDYLSSRVVNINDESEIQLGLDAIAFLSVTTILIGLIYVVKSIPVLIAIIYSKIFIGAYFNQPSIPQSSIRLNIGNDWIQPLIELLIGLILIIYNKRICYLLNKAWSVQGSNA